MSARKAGVKTVPPHAAGPGHFKPAAENGRRILVVVAEMGHNTQREIRGISGFARHAGLWVDIVEGRHFGDKPDFGRWIEVWRPGGLVVDPDYAAKALADKAATRLPMVIWDAAKASGLPPTCARAESDAVAIADAAAGELLRTGFARFAFVPALGDPPWSRNRAAAFSCAMGRFGRAVDVYAPAPDAEGNALLFRKGLARFLATRQRPCGVFAANDATSALVASACADCGLRIPEDVALVGVDDSEEYCERGHPTFSSVRVDIERGGFESAALLEEMVSNGDLRKGRVVRYGVARVVRRASTSVLRARDGRVSRALEWIRRNACTPIGVSDVVSVMGCWRRLADLRFRQATGHTILDEVHARRIDEAMELLRRPDVPIEDIPPRCGYVPGPYLGILFKRTTGLTMRQWRKNALRG